MSTSNGNIEHIAATGDALQTRFTKYADFILVLRALVAERDELAAQVKAFAAFASTTAVQLETAETYLLTAQRRFEEVKIRLRRKAASPTTPEKP